MKIVHFSDWHAQSFSLAPADVYVCTGDMMPNFPEIIFRGLDGGDRRWRANMQLLGESVKAVPAGHPYRRHIDPLVEAELQQRWVGAMNRSAYGKGMRANFGSPDAPVVCVRGNHDFTALAPLFGGEVYEVERPGDVFELSGTRFGGTRGINYINGEWSDEMQADMFNDLCRLLPDDIDVLVTHSPPHGVLDDYNGPLGSDALRSYVGRRQYTGRPLRAHLFGHIHEACGVLTDGNTTFSNSATAAHTLEFWNLKEIEEDETRLRSLTEKSLTKRETRPFRKS